MKRLFLLITALSFILIASCQELQRPGTPETPFVITESVTNDFAVIKQGEFNFINNVWGKKNIKNYNQSVFKGKLGSAEVFGWEWRWPGLHDVVAYPEILYGQSPWNDYSTTTNLPMKLGAKPIKASVKADMKYTGTCNLAFDLWITKTPGTGETNISHEIMIWLKNSGMTPSGSSIGTVTIEGVSYTMWINRGQGSGWTYIAFVPSKTMLDAEINLGLFIDTLLERKILPSEYYLATVELGNEIVSGRGWTIFTDYKITVGK